MAVDSNVRKASLQSQRTWTVMTRPLYTALMKVMAYCSNLMPSAAASTANRWAAWRATAERLREGNGGNTMSGADRDTLLACTDGHLDAVSALDDNLRKCIM